jgi:2-polyprenyl-3-methyl-5-hydroxy-6-metoxy-1,4-benzoquinol methylase
VKITWSNLLGFTKVPLQLYRWGFSDLCIRYRSVEYDAIKADGKYDYVLNLSALKHVRSEKDPFINAND